MHSTTSFRWFAAWGALFALLLAGPSLPAQEATSRPQAKIVLPIGGTVRLQMRSGKPIRAMVNPKDRVITIRTVVGDPATVLITSQQPDVTVIELTDSEDCKETYEVTGQIDGEDPPTQIRHAAPTANAGSLQEPSSKNGPSLEVVPCAAVGPLPVPAAAAPPAKSKLDRILDRLEQIEKRLDALPKTTEENSLPQTDSKQGPRTSKQLEPEQVGGQLPAPRTP